MLATLGNKEESNDSETVYIDRKDLAAGGVAGSGKRWGAAGGADGQCDASESPSRCARNGEARARNESRERRCESSIAALLEEHGRRRRSHARRQIQLQAHPGNEFVRALGDAHRAVQQRTVRKDFRHARARREDGGYGSQREAGGGAESFLRILRDVARKSG